MSAKETTRPTYVAFGIRATLTQHCRREGMPRQLVADRVKSGWPIERALTEPRNDAKAGIRAGATPYVIARECVPWQHDLEARRIVQAFPDGLSQPTVAAIFGVSRQMIEQIERRLYAKLRRTADGRKLLELLRAKQELSDRAHGKQTGWTGYA